MASLVDRNGQFHIVFRYGQTKFSRSLKTSKKREAESCKNDVEEMLRLIKRGMVSVPAGADIPTFVVSKGRRNQELIEQQPGTMTLESLFEEFFTALPDANLETSTIYTMQVHQRHLCDVLGSRSRVDRLGVAELQRYVDRRSKSKGKRGKQERAGNTPPRVELASDPRRNRPIFPADEGTDVRQD